MNKYSEAFEHSRTIREEQYRQLQRYVSHCSDRAVFRRGEYFQPDFSSVQHYERSVANYRKELLELIGYPEGVATHAYGSDIEVKEVLIGEDDLCSIYRLFISVGNGLECYGLYLIPKGIKEKRPLMLAFHGGGGCPEMICNLDDTANYHNASRRFVQEGYIVFSPLFSFESFADEGKSEIPANGRLVLDVEAKWSGTSMFAIELFKVRKALDYLLTRPEIQQDNVHVAGLSYGGFYALLTAAVDTRIKVCLSSCYFSDKVKTYSQRPELVAEWAWRGGLGKFSDAELVALICPRRCVIEMGVGDELIRIEDARPESVKAASVYEQLGISDRFAFIEFEGGHEFNLVEAMSLISQKN